ncbi:MAG: hypothetical protein ACE5JG_06575, partial [Planctomycetota bacterium]
MRRVLCAFLLAAAAVPEELRTPGEEVIAELRAALRSGDGEAAAKALSEVGALYRYPASPEEGKALLKAAAEAAGAPDPRIARAALQALGETRSPAAGPAIEPFLRSVQPAAGQRELALAALEAAGRLASPALVTALLAHARRSPDLVLAEQALRSLGGYDTAPPKLRIQVTDKVLDAARGLSKRRNPWKRLRGPALRALERLCGRPLNTIRHFEQ